ncbi:MAG: aminotransferase class IV [Candidatus Omnitrophica bacterium]|nr:aminotransferase class IV [Candidatus Omnitrophota bacterium]
MKIYFNDKFVKLDTVSSELLDSGLLRGYGCFESMRAVRGKIVYLDAHLKRFFKSARILRLKVPYQKKYLHSAILEAVRLNKFSDAYVKLAAFGAAPKTNVVVIVKKYHPYAQEKYKQGFKIKISSLSICPDLKFSRAKTLSRALLETAFNEAKNTGFDEAILLNKNGKVVEGTRANIFLVKRKIIYTPALNSGCLEGITRKVVFNLAKNNNIEIVQKGLEPKDVFKADEAFLTNSLMGIMPVSFCNRKKIGRAAPGEITRRLIDDYKKIL